MSNDEIRAALLNFSAVWARVSGRAKLPGALVLMPRKTGARRLYRR